MPNVVGIHLSATLVPTVGAGYSYNFDLLTRGKDAGFHMSQSLSLRVGEEAGVGVSLVSGNYQGRGQDATFNSLIGWGADINGALGPVNIGAWGSIDTTLKRASWLGTSIGTGWGIGGSGGVSYTWPIK